MDRVLRVTQTYADALMALYMEPAAGIGKGLGLPEHMHAIFAGESSALVGNANGRMDMPMLASCTATAGF